MKGGVVMGERLKEIRKALKLTQAQLAEDLHITKSMVEKYEYNKSTMTDRTIADICRLYNANETWLRTGEGEMFAPMTRAQEIANIVSSIIKDDDRFCTKLGQFFCQLDDEDNENLENIFNKLIEYVKKEDS